MMKTLPSCRPSFSKHVVTHSLTSSRAFRPFRASRTANSRAIWASAMATESFRYVVVGGGNAAGYAAKEFVAQGLAPNELLIITEEPVVSYERPALSKGYLLGAAKLPGFHTCVGGGGERQEPSWYADKGITFKTSTKVTAIDVAAKTVTLQDGTVVKYDKAILSTGARAVTLADFKTPGHELSGIFYLRNEADGAQLVQAIGAAKESGGQAVVVGGGYIGLEVAAGLASSGVSATMIFPEDRLMARLFTPELASFYESVYASKGVKSIKGAKLTSLKGADGKVSHVVYQTASGEESLPASLVVVGAGARANTELVAGQLDLVPPPVNGIKVDENLRSSNHDVYVVGDVAAFPLLRAGGQLARQEHVTHARSSAAHAVQHILGKTTGPYDYLPYFYSRVFNLSWQFWGSQGDASTTIVHFGAPDKPGAYWVSGGKVVGVFLESATPEEAAAAKKVALETPASPADLAAQGVSFATSRI